MVRACARRTERLRMIVLCMDLRCGRLLLVHPSPTPLRCICSLGAMNGDELGRLIEMAPDMEHAGPRYCRRVLCGCPEGCHRQVEDWAPGGAWTDLCWSCNGGNSMERLFCRCEDFGAECCRNNWPNRGGGGGGGGGGASRWHVKHVMREGVPGLLFKSKTPDVVVGVLAFLPQQFALCSVLRHASCCFAARLCASFCMCCGGSCA